MRTTNRRTTTHDLAACVASLRRVSRRLSALRARVARQRGTPQLALIHLRYAVATASEARFDGVTALRSMRAEGR